MADATLRNRANGKADVQAETELEPFVVPNLTIKDLLSVIP